MEGYNEQEVLAFVDDVFSAFAGAGVAPNRGSTVWIARMQFDAVTDGYAASRAKHLDELAGALGWRPARQADPPVVRSPLDNLAISPRDRFMALVDGRPFGAETLLELEPVLAAAGWALTPPNQLGVRAKIHPPGGPWTRVGFGEGRWMWIEQGET